MATTAGLREPFKTQVELLLAASNGRVTLTSGFRTYDQQVALRRRNGCPDVMRSRPSECRVPTAIPGTSKHESGRAVDFGGDLNVAQLLAPRYGMHRTVTGEPWHYEPIPGWLPPPRPTTQEDDMTFIHTPDGKIVLLHAGRLVWIASLAGVDPDGVNSWDLAHDATTWGRIVQAFGPVVGA